MSRIPDQGKCAPESADPIDPEAALRRAAGTGTTAAPIRDVGNALVDYMVRRYGEGRDYLEHRRRLAAKGRTGPARDGAVIGVLVDLVFERHIAAQWVDDAIEWGLKPAVSTTPEGGQVLWYVRKGHPINLSPDALHHRPGVRARRIEYVIAELKRRGRLFEPGPQP